MNRELLLRDLEANVRGDVLRDDLSLGLYATDASLYQIEPVVVVLPLDREDAVQAMAIANDHGVPIIPRGGGTGLAGQTVGAGMVLDLSKYLNHILEINPEERWARVQPGIARDSLNVALLPHQLHFAPDPATSSRANVGGMMGNNSSGTKSILFGKTVDHVLEMDILLADGTQMTISSLDAKGLENKCQGEDREAQIYQEIRTLVRENRSRIEANYPKVMRRVGGYNLDELLDEEHWNLAKLIVGSEGTLATILEAKLNLEPLPKAKAVCLVHFVDLQESILAVQRIVNHTPAAVEIIDDTVIKMSRENLTTARSCHVIVEDPAAVLIVEFYDDNQDLILDRFKAMIKDLKDHQLGYAYPVHPEGPEYSDVWSIRKKGLGLMLGMKTDKKPIAFIEDAAIPLEHLPAYIAEVKQVCDNHQTQAAMYAHASVGVIHVRPILNMRLQEDIDKFKGIAEDTFKLVKKYGGSWSGEHGDGLVRSAFNPRFFGPELYQALRDVKYIFDPKGLMNPGKIVDAQEIDENLRYGATYQDEPLQTHFHFKQDRGFHNAVHMCSGVGECRKVETGTMCPSYMATRDEEHSTRGRANALRLAMSKQLPGGIANDQVLSALDLCLSCKACKSECPSNVDMAKLKSEVWQQKYDDQGPSRRERLISKSTEMARKLSGSAWTGAINTIQRSKPFRSLMEQTAGIESERSLPDFARETFVQWYRKNYQPPASPTDKVLLFVDTYTNYHEPQIGRGLVALLTKAKVELALADVGCCQRPRLSNGFLRIAKRDGRETLEALKGLGSERILVCEPSCASALLDDLPDLLDDSALLDPLKQRIVHVADYLHEILDKLPSNALQGEQILLHGHCHEKALFGTDKLKQIMTSLGAQVNEIDSGCCGMAGSFGYEKEHYSISQKIGERRLLPAVRESSSDTEVIANGFSCRHQIEHFTDRPAHHWLELFLDSD